MNGLARRRVSTLAVLWTALLYLGVLFLDWHRVKVEVGGVVDVEQAGSGWSDWGFVAGGIAVALVVLVLMRLRKDETATPGRLFTELSLAIALFVFTVAAVFTGDVSVTSGPVGVEVETTLWPAWVGFVLSALIVVAAAVDAAPEITTPARPRLGGPQPHT